MDGIRLNRTVDGLTPEEMELLSGGKRKRKPRQAAPNARIAGKKLHSDKYLWGIYALLLVFSVIELYSASSTEVKGDNVYSPLISHVIYLSLGLGMVLVMQNLHYKYYRKMAWWVAGFSAALVVYSNSAGVVINGAVRAIAIAGFTIQPPEIAKLAVVLVLAKIMAKHQEKRGVDKTGIFLSCAVIAVFALLLFKNGLTNTLLMGTVGAAMLVVGGTQWKRLGIVGLLVIAAGMVVYQVRYSGDKEDEGTAAQVTAVQSGGIDRDVDRSDTHKGRIKAFFEGVNPEDSITDENRQVVFAKIAQAHGGITGNGPGNSRESARLPLAFSDYIYSIIVEDTGFVGGVCLLLLYLCLVARAGVIATKCTKAFPALLIMGCATLIVTQALIHMFIVTGLMPVSGQPLPFISKGGTSIIVMSAAMGMMLSVSKFAVQQRKKGDENAQIKESLADKDESVNPTRLTYESLPD